MCTMLFQQIPVNNLVRYRWSWHLFRCVRRCSNKSPWIIWYVTGEVGICLDVYDAVPTNPREFASRQFFTMNLMEQLLERFDKIPLEEIKVAFERRELLDGVLMRKFHRGECGECIYSIKSTQSFSSVGNSGNLDPHFDQNQGKYRI